MVIFSFLSLASILSFVIAMVHFRGWQMGVSQSITIVILIGIISAQVVHIVQNFNMSHFKERKDIITSVLTKIGPSLLSGSFVVFCSLVFLFGG